MMMMGGSCTTLMEHNAVSGRNTPERWGLLKLHGL
jgi:hypothetical protein